MSVLFQTAFSGLNDYDEYDEDEEVKEIANWCDFPHPNIPSSFQHDYDFAFCLWKSIHTCYKSLIQYSGLSKNSSAGGKPSKVSTNQAHCFYTNEKARDFEELSWIVIWSWFPKHFQNSDSNDVKIAVWTHVPFSPKKSQRARLLKIDWKWPSTMGW